MAASIKISELNSLASLTDVDLFLVSDMESGTSKKVSYSNLKTNLTSDLSSALTDLAGVVSQNNTTVTASIDSVNQSLTISLGEIADDVSDIRQLTGTSDGENVLGSFNGGILPSGITIYSALYMLEAAVASNQTALSSDNATQAELDAYEALEDDMNLGLMLAYNDSPVFIDTLFGG